MLKFRAAASEKPVPGHWMFSFLFGEKSPVNVSRRFLFLTDGFGHPVLVNVDRVDAVHCRYDKASQPGGAVLEYGGLTLCVKESFHDIAAAILGRRVTRG